ncbi:uncharacterized protein LOC143248270 [Tachypleus tridentatus]|uniref:uncharacterized protein LOC143248270 n=1 Tax=Tachypleus tridentatus TaxID=6853 RepID=UPI003FD69A0D
MGTTGTFKKYNAIVVPGKTKDIFDIDIGTFKNVTDVVWRITDKKFLSGHFSLMNQNSFQIPSYSARKQMDLLKTRCRSVYSKIAIYLFDRIFVYVIKTRSCHSKFTVSSTGETEHHQRDKPCNVQVPAIFSTCDHKKHMRGKDK